MKRVRVTGDCTLVRTKDLRALLADHARLAEMERRWMLGQLERYQPPPVARTVSQRVREQARTSEMA